MIELALDSELLVVFGGSDDENPCIFACYQGIWVQRRVRSRLSPPGESLRTIFPPRGARRCHSSPRMGFPAEFGAKVTAVLEISEIFGGHGFRLDRNG